MTLEARLFEEGSDQVSTVDLASVAGPVGDHSLLWVDTSPDDESLSRLEALGIAEAARELTAAHEREITFQGDTIRLSVLGLQGEADRLAPSPLDARAGAKHRGLDPRRAGPRP